MAHKTEKPSLRSVPRKANRAGERTKAFLDQDETFVNATALVGSDGTLLNMDRDSDKLELIWYELRTLNNNITLIMESL